MNRSGRIHVTWCLLLLLAVFADSFAQSEADVLFEKAQEMLKQRQRDSAVYFAKEALPLAASNDTLTGKLEHFIGYVNTIRYRYEDALPHLMKAIHILEPTGQLPHIVADSYLKAGACQRDKELKHALTSEAIERFLVLNDSLNLAAAYLNLGNLCFRQGQIEKFRMMGSQGLKWLGDAPRPDLRTRLNYAQGRYYNGTGNADAALLFFEKTYDELIETNPRDPFIFSICKDYGLLLAEHGEIDKAIAVLKTPILPDTVEKSPHRSGAEADLWFDLGMIYMDNGQFDKAENAYQNSTRSLQPYYGDQHVFTAYPYSELINLYVLMGDEQKARNARDEALAIIESQPVYKHPDYARMSLRMYAGLMGLEEPQKALERLDAGLEAIGFADTSGMSLTSVYRFDILTDLMNRKTELIAALDLPPDEALAQYRLHIDLLDSLQAIQLDPSTRIRLLDENYHVFDKAMATLYRLYETEKSSRYAREMLAMSERSKDQLYTRFLLQNTLKQDYSIPQDLLDQERQLNARLAEIELKLYKEGSPDSLSMLAVESEINELKLSLLEVQNQINFPIDARSLQLMTDTEGMRPDPSYNLMHFFQGERFDYIIAHTKGNYQVLRSADRSALEALVDALRTPDLQWLDPGYEVYEDLAPLIAMMDNSRPLVIVPDGLWSQVPFEALPTGPSSGGDLPPLLIQDAEISYASSLMATQSEFSRRDAAKNLAAYAPSYSQLANIEEDTTGSELYAQLVRSEAYALPGADREAEVVANTIGGNRFSGSEATEEHFRANADQYQILHLSMHALLEDENPNFSRLLFTQSGNPNFDDYLFASELSQLKLNADLAVLSACNTGRGKSIKGEGVMSLSRAFNYAGVPSVVHSLWKVPDDATADIMPQFYVELKAGKRKSAALRKAKLDYLNNTIAPEQKHPYYWAGFVAHGDMQPVKFKSNTWTHYLLVGSIALAVLLILGSRSRKRRKSV